MPKPVWRSLLTAGALLALFAVSPALGAYTSTALLGNRELGSHRNDLSPGRVQAFRLRTHTSGVTGVVHLYIDRGSTARAVAIGIYSDEGGRPGWLLSEGDGSSLKMDAWSTVSMTSAHLESGTIYWLAVLGEHGALRYSSPEHGSCLSYTSISTHLRKLPDRWGRVDAQTNCPISAYVLARSARLSPSLLTSDFPSPPSAPSPPAALPGEPPSAPSPPTNTQPSEEPPPPAAPTDTTPPTISGSAVEGETLKASTGSWSGSPTSYAYQWEECNGTGESCSDVTSDGSGATYTLGSEDVGHTVRVVVTASNAGGSTPASSAVTDTVLHALPPAPTNTKPPVISGSAIEGETLKASTGSWSGSPTSYAYQWEECNALSKDCMPVGGATSSSYTLTPEDVESDVRVVVTASNAGGSTPASSAMTDTVLPLAPANTKPPVISGTAVEGETLKASTGSWSENPTSYAYQWQDCNSAGESCSDVGTSGATYALGSEDVGHTVRVVVTASNAGGSTPASSAVTDTVLHALPPAPTNTKLPVIGGSTVEGKTLTTSDGTWTESPTSFAYQWEDCNASGTGCTAIGGATASTRALASSDVGHTLRVVVKATNAGGAGEATSQPTSVVTAPEGKPTGCFEDPESEGTSRFEACGYPGPKNTGVAETSGKTECSSLPEWNPGTEPMSENATIEGKELKISTASKNGGGISTSAHNVTLNKDCFMIEGKCRCLQEGPALKFEANVTLTVEHSTFRSPSPTESVEKDIWFNSSGSDIIAQDDRFEDCGECLNGLGTVEVTGSYMDANQWAGKEPENNELHRENIYMMQGTATVKDSTMFVPDDETAEIFDEDNGIACDTHVTFEDDFLSGSGQMFQLCGHSNGQVGIGSTIINHNRFARCLTKPIVKPSNGIPNCSGPYTEGADSHGFMPSGGSTQILGNGETNPYGAKKEFEGNYWDDNLETITVKEAEE
jgi:hypothetical protein